MLLTGLDESEFSIGLPQEKNAKRKTREVRYREKTIITIEYLIREFYVKLNW